jgi:hypothetical protein
VLKIYCPAFCLFSGKNGIACSMLDLRLFKDYLKFCEFRTIALSFTFIINKFAQNQGQVQVDLGHLFHGNEIKQLLFHRTLEK